jgi:hypothetical protein
LSSKPSTPAQLDAIGELIDRWLDAQLADNPTVAAVDRDPSIRRWYVRLTGEQKATFTVWFTLRERTLHYETYLMPAPEENLEATFEHLLRRNLKLYGAALTIGEENGIFLVGQLDVRWIDEPELDRILGSLFAYTEQFFRPAMRLGFESQFRG